MQALPWDSGFSWECRVAEEHLRADLQRFGESGSLPIHWCFYFDPCSVELMPLGIFLPRAEAASGGGRQKRACPENTRQKLGLFFIRDVDPPLISAV